MEMVSNNSLIESPQARVLIVDDHPLFREALKDLVIQNKRFSVCGESDTATSALGAMRKLIPDLIITDISLPGTNGIELIKLMHAEMPHMKILVLSMHEETIYALRALRAGASGYVMKSEPPAVVTQAVEMMLNGEMFVSPRFAKHLVMRAVQSADCGLGSPVDSLSDRELEVFQLIGRNLGTREIAKKLNLSVKTIETHRARVKEKLGCKESAEMVKFAIEWSDFTDAEERVV